MNAMRKAAAARLLRRFSIVAVAVLLLTLPTVGANAIQDQPQIAFASGESPVSPDTNPVDLYVANADGSALTKLAAGTYWPWAWSPDGSSVAFFSFTGGSDKLVVRALDATEPFVVADVGTVDNSSGPMWSPDSTRIAFVSSMSGNAEVYVADVARRTARNVSNDPWETSNPRWSPDGSFVAYDMRSEETIGIDKVDVYIVPASGGDPVNVTDDNAWSPGGAWSPDSSRFVFVRNVDGDDDIYVSDGDGTDPVQLTNNTANDRDPTWSPDGSAIAYSSGLDDTSNPTGPSTAVIPSRLYVMSPDGSNVRAITDGANDPDTQPPPTHGLPTWSPDGSLLAYVIVDNSSGARRSYFSAYVVDPSPDGQAAFKLGSGPGYASLNWSPDGTRIAMNASGNYGIDSRNVIVAAVPNATPVGLPGGVGSGFAGWSTYGAFTAYMNQGGAGPGDTVFVADPDGTNPLDITQSLVGPVATAAQWRPQPLGPVGLVDPSNGLWRLRNAWGVVTSFYYGDPGDIPFMGDWDCDGVNTPGLYRQSDGYVYLRNSNTQGNADIRFFFGNPGDVPLSGDFNGDGCDTVSIYRPSEQRFYIINELGANNGGLGPADFDFAFGNAGDEPVVGDWDGDGFDEVGLYRESTGLFYWRTTLTTGVAHDEILFGDANDRFVAGDWGTPDGVETPAVFRPSDTTFYFRHTLT